jgi:TolB-like protein
MKRCPSCNRVETDDTLAFCRVDGTALVSDSSSPSESSLGLGANASSEIETSILPHSTGAGISRATSATTVFNAQSALARTQKLASSKSRRAIVLTMVGLIVIAFALLLYFYRARNNTTTIDSIAVLPFANSSTDPNTDFLSDGITESIISSLSQLPQLKVLARSTVFQYKGKDVDPRKVGHDLGVRAVLMGRLIQQGDNLTIRTELVNVSDGTELWGQQYNRKLADVFAVQEEIAKEISERLRLRLTNAERQQLARRPTENLKAFQYYMQSRQPKMQRLTTFFTTVGFSLNL